MVLVKSNRSQSSAQLRHPSRSRKLKAFVEGVKEMLLPAARTGKNYRQTGSIFNLSTARQTATRWIKGTSRTERTGPELACIE